MICQIDSKSEWLLLSESFAAKYGLVFVLALENAFSWRFFLKAKGKIRDFQISPPFARLAFFVTISGNFQRFQYFNFETDFLENEKLSQKIAVPFFS